MSKIVTIRHSELKDYRQCPLKWYLRWILNWVPDNPNPKFELGTQWHYLMDAYFNYIMECQNRGVEPNAEDAGKAAASIIPTFTKDEERIDLLLWMLEGYIDFHGVHPDWEIVAVEPSYIVPMYFDGKKTRYRLETNPDLIVRHRGLRNRLVTIDHKSTGSLKRQIEIDLDDQLGVQMLAAGRHFKEPVLYPMLNQARTNRLVRPMLPGERYALRNSFRSAQELEMIERDIVRACREMSRPVDAPYSSPNPMTCMYSCEFLEAHIALRRSGGRDLTPLLLAHGMHRGERPPSGSHLPTRKGVR